MLCSLSPNIHQITDINFEVMRAVMIQTVVFWVVTPSNLVDGYLHFRLTCSHHVLGWNVHRAEQWFAAGLCQHSHCWVQTLSAPMTICLFMCFEMGPPLWQEEGPVFLWLALSRAIICCWPLSEWIISPTTMMNQVVYAGHKESGHSDPQAGEKSPSHPISHHVTLKGPHSPPPFLLLRPDCIFAPPSVSLGDHLPSDLHI
jgi:hypothetical protein